MAGPEPYPQEKWTVAQEQAYAEGRASAKKGTGPASRSGKRKRYVKTKEGERRYGQPIGTEIGNPRNAKAAEAQKDSESTDRYSELVGADQAAQAGAMRSLNDDQLQRLSRVAYSFKSANPEVVRLRVGVANELRRRGMNVNDFGGLGGGSTQTAGPVVPRTPGLPPRRKSAPPKKKAPVKPVRSAMTARKNDRRLRELSVPQLRAALGVFSRIPLDHRRGVARVLVRRALELSAPNLLGRSVIEAAQLPDQQQAQIIELAGKWKHGWIPLDGVAVASKMKGKTGGKRWWDGSAGKGGVSGRVHSGVGVPKSGGGQTGPRKSGRVVSAKDAGHRFQHTTKRQSPEMASMERGRRTSERMTSSPKGRQRDLLLEAGLPSGKIETSTPEQLRRVRKKLKTMLDRGLGESGGGPVASRQRHDAIDALQRIEDKLGIQNRHRTAPTKVGQGRPTEAQYLARSRRKTRQNRQSTGVLQPPAGRRGKA